VSDSKKTHLVHNVDYTTDVAVLSGIRSSSDLQNPPTSDHSHIVSDNSAECWPSQSVAEILIANPSAGLYSREMCASPPPNDCLNDLWLNSAAVDLGSPLMLRGSGSWTLVHRGT